MKKFAVSILRYLQYAGLLLGFGCAHITKSPGPEIALVEFCLGTATSLSTTANAPVLGVDTNYLLPTEHQIDLMRAYCASHRTKLYAPEIWDCDDIAKEYRVNAEKWMLATFGPRCPAGLAIAEMYVHIEGVVDGIGDYGRGGRHAMVAVKRADDVWILIEPGNGKWIPLDRAVFEGVVEVHTCVL